MFKSYYLNIVYHFLSTLSKILLTLSPFLLISFNLLGSDYIIANTEIVILFTTLILSLSLYLKYEITKKQSLLNNILLIFFVILAIIFIALSRYGIVASIFGIGSNIWNQQWPIWNVIMILSCIISFIAIQEFGVYKRFFYLLSGIQMIVFIFNIAVIFFNINITSEFIKNICLSLQSQLFVNHNIWTPGFVIFCSIFVSFVFKSYLDYKKIVIINSKNIYIRNSYFLFAILYLFLFTYFVYQYFIFKKINNIIYNVGLNLDVAKAYNSIIEIKSFYKNDAILIAENTILDINRKFLFNKINSIDSIDTQELEKFISEYIVNVNAQIKNAKEAIEFNPMDYKNHIELAIAYEKAGIVTTNSPDGNAYDKAIQRYQIAQDISPQHKDEIYIMMAKLSLSRIDKSIENNQKDFAYYMQKALESDPNSKKVLENFLLFYIEKNDIINGQKYFDKLMDNYPDDIEVNKLAGIWYYNLAEYDKATIYLLKYLNYNKNNNAMLLYLFKSLYNGDRVDEAKKVYISFIKDRIKEFSNEDVKVINKMIENF